MRGRSAAQLPFALPLAPAYDRAAFVLGACNREALAAIDRWPADWPRGGVLIYGSAACGKSHLVSLWCEKARARRLKAAELAGLELAGLADLPPAVAVEDLCGALPAEAETALFHLFNQLQQRGGSLLVSARLPAAQWTIALPDLATRLGALAAIAIGAPDDVLIEAVLAKLFADRQVAVDAETLTYARRRMQRSFADLRTLVEAVDSAALAAQRPITVPLVRAVLQTLWPEDAPDPS